MDKKSCKVLIGVSGSVAAIKLPELIQTLFTRFEEEKVGVQIRVVMTTNSKHFISKERLHKDHRVEVLDDADEWSTWDKIGDPVLHIVLRRWADIFVLAPIDANTLAKLTNGICDNLLTCVARAWDSSKPLVYCPAMNTFMYEHPITAEQIDKLNQFGYIRIDCVEKTLACGDVGTGAMAPVGVIVEKLLDLFMSDTKK